MSTRPETYHGSRDKVGLRTLDIGISASNILTALHNDSDWGASHCDRHGNRYLRYPV